MLSTFKPGPYEAGRPGTFFADVFSADGSESTPAEPADLRTAVAQYRAAEAGQTPFRRYEYDIAPEVDPQTMIADCKAALAGDGSFYRFQLRLAGSHLKVNSVGYFPPEQQPVTDGIDTVQLEGFTWQRNGFRPVPSAEIEVALAEAVDSLEPAA